MVRIGIVGAVIIEPTHLATKFKHDQTSFLLHISTTSAPTWIRLDPSKAKLVMNTSLLPILASIDHF